MSGPDNALPQSSIVLYQTEDGRTRIQCRFDVETLWLSQAQIAELFQTSVPNINLHLKAIYAERELTEAATIKSYLIVRHEGAREVSREVLHYSLPAILTVGYRVLADAQPRPVDADFEQAARLIQKRPRPKALKSPKR